jgi:uncharacterized protein
MGLKVERWSDAHEFLDATRAFLTAREAEHCLLLGIASTLVSHPDYCAEPRFWTVREDERIVAVALRTPPHNLVLSHVDEPRWLTALAHDVLASDELPGVLGPTDATRTLADMWSERNGRSAVRVMQERIFRLDRVIPPPAAPGRCREAQESDRALLAAWIQAFQIEAFPAQVSTDAAESADRFLRRAARVPYLWEDAGGVVAFAGAAGATPNGIRIGPVYTPPDLRGRGYASNLVAAVSQLQLASGRSFCFLFTDLTNPTSNHIYQMIGYAPVTDVDQYRFPAA